MTGVTVRRASLFAALAAAALVAALQVSPATAAGTSRQTSWLCNSAEFSSFSSLSRIASPGFATARGGRSREPAQDETLDTGDTTRRTTRTSRERAGLGARDHAGRNHRQRLAGIIDDQIAVLNNTYAGGEGGVDTGFRFTLVGVDRTVNADWYNAEANGAERAMKRALHRGGRTRSTCTSRPRATSSAGPTCRRSSPRATRSWTASSSTGSRCAARRTGTAGSTTRARRRRTRSATG